MTILDPVHLAPPRSAYVHVPFCSHRCGYCDFTLVAGKDHLIENYLCALEQELSTIGSREPIELDTLYFGGGTPTHLSPEQLRRMFALVFRHFRLADDAEFTAEANPVDLTPARIDALVAAGVNRISLGVQSFDTDVLQLLERDHSEAQVLQGIELLRQNIPNFSIDLIFGVPGQSLELWRETLRKAVALTPAHLSTYGLTFEKGTAFWTRREKGELQQTTDDLERDMYAETMTFLPEWGFEQYEISSFAQPGKRSRHNRVYWSGRSYLAFGPGASSYLDGVRCNNHRSVSTWMSRVLAGESGVGEREQLDDESRARERLVLGLRQCDGIEVRQFERETGYSPEQLADEPLRKFVKVGLLHREGTTLRLTHAGRFVCDGIVSELL